MFAWDACGYASEKDAANLSEISVVAVPSQVEMVYLIEKTMVSDAFTHFNDNENEAESEFSSDEEED